MKNAKRLLTACIALALMLSSGPATAGMGRQGAGVIMEMLHLHSLMNHGLEMIAEGSNIVMFSQSQTIPPLDEMTLEHGRKMIKEGEAVIERVLKGPEIKLVLKAGHGNDPSVRDLRELGNAELSFARLAEKLGEAGQGGRKTRHIRVLIDHTLVMAAQGSDLVITGQMKMTDTDAYSIEHGRMMLFDSRSLLSSVKGMELDKVNAKDGAMARTVAAGKTAGKIIDLLDKMAGQGNTPTMSMSE